MDLDPKKIKYIIPMLTGLLILFGYIRFSIYYNYFGIDLIDYIEFTEILTMFLPDIIYYGSFIFAIFLFRFLIDSKERSINIIELRETIEEEDKFITRLKYYYTLHPYFFFGTFILLILGIITWLIKPNRLIDFILLTSFFPVFLFFTIIHYEFRYKYKQIYGYKFDYTFSNLLLIAFLFGYYTIFSTKYSIDKKLNNIEDVRFIFNEEEIITTRNLIYLGQTKNYLFLYDKSNNTSSTFSKKEIKKIVKRQ